MSITGFTAALAAAAAKYGNANKLLVLVSLAYISLVSVADTGKRGPRGDGKVLRYGREFVLEGRSVSVGGRSRQLVSGHIGIFI